MDPHAIAFIRLSATRQPLPTAGQLLTCLSAHGLSVLAYGSLCRGLLSGKMTPDTVFKGDDLRRHDPKFKEPAYSHYLKAVAELNALAAARYGKAVLDLSIRWVLDKGAIALWGARHPGQLEPVGGISGWSLNPGDMQAIDAIIERHIAAPIGPEFMAPPSREKEE